MTLQFRSRTRRLVALACLATLAGLAIPSGPTFARRGTAARTWNPYREAADVASIAPSDVEAIYYTALRFYRPPRNQFRRLDLRLLPAAPGDRTTRTLDPSLAARLLRRLGDRFCLLDSPGGCRQEMGGDLRVSGIYASSPDTARVIVACRMVLPGNVTTDNGAQAFLIARGPKGWLIADRGGVGTPQ